MSLTAAAPGAVFEFGFPRDLSGSPSLWHRPHASLMLSMCDGMFSGARSNDRGGFSNEIPRKAKARRRRKVENDLWRDSR